MTDTVDKAVRSRIMRGIKGKNTRPEIILRKFLHSNGYRFRLHNRNLPGTPDIVLKKYNTAIFVNGCFWHGHQGCKYYTIPKTNTNFWTNKVETNIKRDLRAQHDLKDEGWTVIIVWTCELKNNVIKTTLLRILSQLSAIRQSDQDICWC